MEEPWITVERISKIRKMAEAIHSWNYIQDRKYPAKIELYFDHVLQHQGRPDQDPIRYSFETFFLLESIVGNPLVDYELLEYIVTISVAEEFSPEAQKVYHFYKNFNHKEVKAGNYEHGSHEQSSVRYFRTINSYGLEQYYENEEGIYIQSRQRFDQFFLRGPLMTDLPLDLRRQWRCTVWAAMADSPEYKLEDGFPLFDYSKIVPKSYKKQEEDKDAGLFVELHDGHILIGGWEGRDGGAQKYSIEQIWYDERLIPEPFTDYLHEIHDNLAGAIVEGPRSRKYRRKKQAEKVQDSGQQPGEAPPA